MRKLVQCKTCGAEIAKTAKVCPRCGAKQHQAALALVSLIVVLTVFIVIFMIVNMGNGSQPNGSDASPVEVSAQDLWAAYSENAVNADSQYKGKTLAVTGVIVNIGQDVLSSDPCVSLKSGDQLGIYPVQCFFTDETQNEKVSKLRDGQSVTIIGRCTGVPLMIVQLSDCRLQD